MEEQIYSNAELLGAYFFMGSITFLLGIVTQIAVLRRKGSSWFRVVSFVVAAQILSSIFGVLIWLNWPFSFNVMQGFLLLPVAIPEIILVGLYYFLVSPQKE